MAAINKPSGSEQSEYNERISHYEAFEKATDLLRSKMTPAQKRRSFIREQNLAESVCKSTIFYSVFGLGGVVYPFDRLGDPRKVHGTEAIAIERTPLMWNVVCYAICKDTAGHPYIKGLEISLKEKVKHSAINASLYHIHYDWMRENVNMKHVLTLGWSATTGEFPTEKMAMHSFLKLSVFDSFDYVSESDESGNFLINLKGEAA